jgi:hypothetical protein
MRPQIQAFEQGSVVDKPRTSQYTSLSVATLQERANSPGLFHVVVDINFIIFMQRIPGTPYKSFF